MKNAMPPDRAAPVHAVFNFIRRWNRFWFHPADPTPLGFIRLLAGLTTFYVILAYSVDLQELFGENAWIDRQASDALRHEFPFLGRQSKWEEMPKPLPKPESAAELEYVQKFQERWFGADPRQSAAQGYPVWSIWFHVTDPAQMVAVHCVILAIVFLFAIGFCTRVTSVLTWVGVISYVQRAPTTLFGMDAMMNIVLVYLMIGPSGAALSVDRLIARWWTTRRALRARKPAPELKPTPSVSANLALRLLQVHLCIIYLSAGLAKLKGPAWWNGTAIWGTMANPEFSPMHWGPFVEFVKFLAHHRWLWEVSMTSAVIFTLVMEIGFAFLIWNRRLRWVYLTMAAMLHTGIAVFMGLNTFSLMMFAMLLAFVPLSTYQWILRKLGQGAPRLRLVFNSRFPRQARAASLIRTFDAWDQVEIVDSASIRRTQATALQTVATLKPESTSEDSRPFQVVTAQGEVLTGYALFWHLTRSLRLLWLIAPAAWLLGVVGLGNTWFPGGGEPPAVTPQVENGKHHARGKKITS